MPPGAVSLILVLVNIVLAAGTVAFIKEAKSTHGLIVAMFKVSFWYHLDTFLQNVNYTAQSVVKPQRVRLLCGCDTDVSLTS